VVGRQPLQSVRGDRDVAVEARGLHAAPYGDVSGSAPRA
jgi:hypothetical protein